MLSNDKKKSRFLQKLVIRQITDRDYLDFSQTQFQFMGPRRADIFFIFYFPNRVLPPPRPPSTGLALLGYVPSSSNSLCPLPYCVQHIFELNVKKYSNKKSNLNQNKNPEPIPVPVPPNGSKWL